ncbi:MAG: energy-coupling factor transporter ATPase [Clostridia bacterium]|nr:energy-coupling factor transporter ATPase [Clostridia bacterium]
MISAENVSYTYTPGGAFEKAAVCRVSFSVEAGSFCGIIGQTGSGKTTLMQLLAGLEKPTEGRVCVDGLDVADKKNRAALKGKIGLVFQYPEYQLFGETVVEDVMFGPLNLGFSEEDAKKKAIQALAAVDIGEDFYAASPFTLSGGQKRRVAIAGVLAMEPEILILDEPTAGLDPRGRDALMQCISSIQKTKGMTVLWVSHSMEEIARLVDRILVMSHGELVMDGAPAAVFCEGNQLREMGLDVPEITRIVEKLRARGLEIPASIYTVEEACRAILALKEGNPC